jgi:hypothetical protein
MVTLQQQVAKKFLANLSESKDVDKERIDQLRTLLADGKKVKAEDLVRSFCSRLVASLTFTPRFLRLSAASSRRSRDEQIMRSYFRLASSLAREYPIPLAKTGKCS